MQDLQIRDAVKDGTMQEEAMDTDAVASVSIKDTATNAQAKIAQFLLLGLVPNETIKHVADASIVAVKIKEDKAAAATAKLLRGLRNKNGVTAEDDDMNNNEDGAAAAAIDRLKSLKVEDEDTPSAIHARNPTSGNPGPADPKWIASYPKRWQNPPPLANLSKPSHPFHEVWQKWNPDHKPTGQDAGKNTGVQMDMI